LLPNVALDKALCDLAGGLVGGALVGHHEALVAGAGVVLVLVLVDAGLVDAAARGGGALGRRGLLPGVFADEAQVVLAQAALPLADLDGANGLLLHVGDVRGVVDEEPVLLGLDELTLLEIVPGVVPAHLGVHLDEPACLAPALGHFPIFGLKGFHGLYAADGARHDIKLKPSIDCEKKHNAMKRVAWRNPVAKKNRAPRRP
jgi:hypothetical protein